MCSDPEMGPGHDRGRPRPRPSRLEPRCGTVGSSPGPSHSERKIIAVNAPRLLSSIDPVFERWCSARSRRSELRSISPGRPRRSAPGSIPAGQPPGGSESGEAGGRTRLREARGTGPNDERPSEGGPTGTTDLLGGAVAGAERAVRVCILPSEHANQLRRIFGVSGGEASI